VAITPLRPRNWEPLVRVMSMIWSDSGLGRLDLDSDEEFGAETTRLPVCASGELGAADAIGKAGVILDAGARAGLPAGRVPLAHQRAKPL
jgi:hypothetical protein